MNYKWIITELTTQTVGDLQNVVTDVKWNLFADNGGLGTRYVGNTAIPTPDIANFVPFDQLTQEIVQSWIEPIVTGDAAGWQAINDTILTQIATAEAGFEAYKKLPWNKLAVKHD